MDIGPPPPLEPDPNDWLRAAREAEAKRFRKRARPDETGVPPAAKRERVAQAPVAAEGPPPLEPDPVDWLKQLQDMEAKRFGVREKPKLDKPRQDKAEIPKEEKKAKPEQREQKKKRWELGRTDGSELEIRVYSNEYDDLGKIPYVRGWSGVWLESMPMQSTFRVPLRHYSEALDALEKLGYTGSRWVDAAKIGPLPPLRAASAEPPRHERPPPPPAPARAAAPPPAPREQKKGDKRWEFGRTDGREIEVRVFSNEYDDLGKIPYVRGWSGAWKESMPMQAEFRVPVEHVNAALNALEKLGYTGDKLGGYDQRILRGFGAAGQPPAPPGYERPPPPEPARAAPPPLQPPPRYSDVAKVKTFAAREALLSWTFDLSSGEGEDIVKRLKSTGMFPEYGSIFTWDGIWVNRLPAQTSFSVVSKYGPSTVIALRELGYTEKTG
jgi:hypothetical protein